MLCTETTKTCRCLVLLIRMWIRATGDVQMQIESLVVLLVVGAVAGWLAGQIMKGYGFGLIGNIAVGVAGAFIASMVLPAIGVSIGSGILGSIIHSTIGAVILLFLIGLVKRA